MDAATIRYISKHLCHPMWLSSDSEMSIGSNNKHLSLMAASTMDTDYTADNRTEVEERSPCDERDCSDDAVEIDLLDVVSKLVLQRDELIRENVKNEEDIKLLLSDNENFHIINEGLHMDIENLQLENEELRKEIDRVKRSKAKQQKQMDQLKVDARSDRQMYDEKTREMETKIQELEDTITKLRSKNIGAIHALDDGIFWSEQPEQLSKSTVVENNDINNTNGKSFDGFFDSMLGESSPFNQVFCPQHLPYTTTSNTSNNNNNK